MTEQELFSKVEIISLQNKDDLILSNVSQIIVEEHSDRHGLPSSYFQEQKVHSYWLE